MVANPRPQIIGMGASTPIGRNVWTSAAAARAGICGFLEHPFMIDTAGEPMRVARAPWLDVDVKGVDRYCALLLPAIDEALVSIREKIKNHHVKMGLALALPSTRPNREINLAENLVRVIAKQFDDLFIQIQFFEAGHAAGHLALDFASSHVVSNQWDVCVVAGVDSYLAPEILEWIEECDQLHGGGPLNNAWGFIPGEAASAMLLSSNTVAQQLEVDIFGEIVSIGLGQETKLIKTDAVCIGEGLTQAFRKALAGLEQGELIHNVFCDLNGEKYRADEYGFTTLRTKEYFQSPSDFVALADCWGDVGAAGAPLHVIQAVISSRKRYGKGPFSMIWASSETGERGAAIIRAPDWKVH